MPATVDEVPDIMRARGWNEGANIISRWFSRPSHSDPLTGTPDFDTITMNWVRSFSRGRNAIDTALRNKIWLTDNAKRNIMKTLVKRHRHLPGTHRFFFDNINNANPTDFPQGDWEDVDSDYVTQITVGSQTDTLDGLKAALGRWNVRFLVAGTTTNTATSADVTINQVGLYVRDSFDFNDSDLGWNPKTWVSQPLGFWNRRNNGVTQNPLDAYHCYTERQSGNVFQIFGGSLPPNMPRGMGRISIDVPQCETYSYLSNVDFRAYRTETGMGGDFLIFSDIENQPSTDSFTFAVPPGGWSSLV